MSRTAEKIAHLRKTASEHPEYGDALLPFEEIFPYVEGKEAGTGIRFAVPEGNGAERVQGGLPLLSPEALSVDRDAATAFLSGLLAFVLDIPLKTALERVSSSLPPDRFDGWKEGFERGK